MNGIITKDYNWSTNATRAGYMEIFANALPASALAEMNVVTDGSIPDVPMTHPQAASIYKLYRAGILQGSNAQHSCNPSSSIKRSEVAAILTRMMYPDARISFSIGAGVLAIKTQPQDVTAAVGDPIAFTVAAEGGKEPYTYQWYYTNDYTSTWDILGTQDWVKNPNSSTVQIRVDASDDDAGYRYMCRVTDNNTGEYVYSNSCNAIIK